MEVTPSQKKNLSTATIIESMVKVHGLNAIQGAFKDVADTLDGIGINCPAREVLDLFVLIIRHNGITSFINKAKANLTRLDKEKVNLSAALENNNASIEKVAERLSNLMASGDDAVALRALKLIVPVIQNSPAVRSSSDVIDIDSDVQTIKVEEIDEIVSNKVYISDSAKRFNIDE